MILENLKKISISEILIVVLLIIILLQRCGGGKTPENPVSPKITRDTIWMHKDSTIISKPQLIKTEPYVVPVDRWNTQYLPDTNYAKLLKQYEELVRKFLATNIQKDVVNIDSIGHIYITDSISSNLVKNRLVTWNLKYPVITNTITILEPKKVHYYLGGYIQGEKGNLIDQIGTQLLIKNKREQVFGVSAGINSSWNLKIGLSTYWKIR